MKRVISKRQNKEVRKIRKKNVYEAIKLVRARADGEKKKDVEEQNCKQISSHCISTHLNKKGKRMPVIPFSKSLITAIMRSYMSRQDWRHMQHLFPLLLSYSNDLEPLMWRYALLILLYSPDSSPSNLDAFLEMCIGSNQTLDSCQILENILSLPRRES